jgi:hypothetical protein
VRELRRWVRHDSAIFFVGVESGDICQDGGEVRGEADGIEFRFYFFLIGKMNMI